MFGNSLHSLESLHNLALALELEGDGDNAYREHVHLLGHTGYDGGGSCAGATTHAGGDEDHLGVVAEEGTDVLDALLSCLAGHFGVVAGTKSLTQLYLDGDVGRDEGLTVGVTEHEGDVADTFAIHVLDGIATASTHTNDFDNVGICCWQIDGEYVSFFHKIR